jgi:hypothetical protein
MPTDQPSFSRSIATHAVTGLASGAIVLAASAMFATRAPSGEPAKVKVPEVGPMVVSKLIVMDGEGKARIVLDVAKSGTARIHVANAGDDARAGVTIEASDLGNSVAIRPTGDRSKSPHLTMMMSGEGGLPFIQGISSTGERVFDLLPAR